MDRYFAGSTYPHPDGDLVPYDDVQEEIDRLHEGIKSFNTVVLERDKQIERLQRKINKQSVEIGGLAQQDTEADTVIESLREQVAHEERRAKAAEFAGVEAMKRGDEWKRRARLLETLIPNKLRTPEINRWFKNDE